MTSEKNKKNVTQNATKQEIGAALKLIGLLYEQGEIPKHVYRNICNEYYGKGLDKVADARYTIPNTEDKEAVWQTRTYRYAGGIQQGARDNGK